MPRLLVPLLPLLHGALGYWDEVLNAVPLVLGAALLCYLYYTSRRRRARGEPRERREEQ
jgi:hypothetical protein